MQKQLDHRIKQEHQLLNVNVVKEKILAFQVELAELANETRCFKYWSKKPASERGVIIEEYVDGIHFLLSIGIELNYDSVIIHASEEVKETLTEQFLHIFDCVAHFKQSQSMNDFIALFEQYLGMAYLLNFKQDEIEMAYIGKNQINHDRQTEGY